MYKKQWRKGSTLETFQKSLHFTLGSWCPCSAPNLYTTKEKQVSSFHAKHLAFLVVGTAFTTFHDNSHRLLRASNFKTQPQTGHWPVQCLCHVSHSVCMCVWVQAHVYVCVYVNTTSEVGLHFGEIVWDSRQCLSCPAAGCRLWEPGYESYRILLSTSPLTQEWCSQCEPLCPAPNSGSHTCPACTWLTEPSPHP